MVIDTEDQANEAPKKFPAKGGRQEGGEAPEKASSTKHFCADDTPRHTSPALPKSRQEPAELSRSDESSPEPEAKRPKKKTLLEQTNDEIAALKASMKTFGPRGAGQGEEEIRLGADDPGGSHQGPEEKAGRRQCHG